MSRPVSRRIARYHRHPVRVRDGGVDVFPARGGRARCHVRPDAPAPLRRRVSRGPSLEHEPDGLCALELVIGTAIFVVLVALAAAARLVW